MDTKKIDLLLKYCLAVAGQEDPGDRELGPIHLIKYVYLADLAYAREHEGQTFSGVRWKFHHFGPWSQEVHARIEPVILEVGAEERVIQSYKYEADTIRWSISDESLLSAIEREIPLEIKQAIKKLIHKFGDDTTGLLHFVYATAPMLCAAPGEDLSFMEASSVAEEREEWGKHSESLRGLSKEARKRMQELKERIKSKAHPSTSAGLVPPSPLPRYDNVFIEGQKWLDSLAGSEIESTRGELSFSDDIWKSPGRREPHVS